MILIFCVPLNWIVPVVLVPKAVLGVRVVLLVLLPHVKHQENVLSLMWKIPPVMISVTLKQIVVLVRHNLAANGVIILHMENQHV